MPRSILRTVHRTAALLATGTILLFWSATALTELSGSTGAIVLVKQGILFGMAVLIPAVVVAGITGFRLGGRSPAPAAAAKRRRMPVIALNGVLVLVPAAVFLALRASGGDFDVWFVVVQGIELAAGALNITLMALNIRDGMRLSGRRKGLAGGPRPSSGAAGQSPYPIIRRGLGW